MRFGLWRACLLPVRLELVGAFLEIELAQDLAFVFQDFNLREVYSYVVGGEATLEELLPGCLVLKLEKICPVELNFDLEHDELSLSGFGKGGAYSPVKAVEW